MPQEAKIEAVAIDVNAGNEDAVLTFLDENGVEVGSVTIDTLVFHLMSGVYHLNIT